VEEEQRTEQREEKTMETIQRQGWIFVCLVLFMTIASVVMTGCTDSAAGQQRQVTAVHEQQNENPTGKVTAAVTLMTTGAPAQKTVSPAPAPDSSPDMITFDPVGEKKTGESFALIGTTSLPAGTNLFWQIMPDTGKTPAGIDISAPLGVMANNQVKSGKGNSNTVSLSVDGESTKDLPKGKYIVIVVSLKGDPSTTDPTTGTLAGYTSVPLK
jgi:hypothetical protein